MCPCRRSLPGCVCCDGCFNPLNTGYSMCSLRRAASPQPPASNQSDSDPRCDRHATHSSRTGPSPVQRVARSSLSVVGLPLPRHPAPASLAIPVSSADPLFMCLFYRLLSCVPGRWPPDPYSRPPPPPPPPYVFPHVFQHQSQGQKH